MSLKGFFLFIFSCLLVVGALVFSPTVLERERLDGQRTVYLYSKSSSAIAVTMGGSNSGLTRLALMGVRGESVFFSDKAKGLSRAGEVVKNCGARFVFEEKIGRIVCKYYYSPAIYTYLVLNGTRVNLQVVQSDVGITIASPLVFDGF